MQVYVSIFLTDLCMYVFLLLPVSDVSQLPIPRDCGVRDYSQSRGIAHFNLFNIYNSEQVLNSEIVSDKTLGIHSFVCYARLDGHSGVLVYGLFNSCVMHVCVLFIRYLPAHLLFTTLLLFGYIRRYRYDTKMLPSYSYQVPISVGRQILQLQIFMNFLFMLFCRFLGKRSIKIDKSTSANTTKVGIYLFSFQIYKK